MISFCFTLELSTRTFFFSDASLAAFILDAPCRIFSDASLAFVLEVLVGRFVSFTFVGEDLSERMVGMVLAVEQRRPLLPAHPQQAYRLWHLAQETDQTLQVLLGSSTQVGQVETEENKIIEVVVRDA